MVCFRYHYIHTTDKVDMAVEVSLDALICIAIRDFGESFVEYVEIFICFAFQFYCFCHCPLIVCFLGS